MNRQGNHMSPLKRFVAKRTNRLDQSGEPDSGVILVMFALLLLPIVVFVALAIDIANWYNRATVLQRSADAAALSGAVWMPNLGNARGHGKTTNDKNGFHDGVDDIQIHMDQGDRGSTSFEVCITDTDVQSFFAKVFSGNESIKRCATAQYGEPIKMGTPKNWLGGDSNTDVTGYESDNNPIPASMNDSFWLTMMSSGSNASWGDRYSPACLFSAAAGHDTTCTPENPQHSTDGQYYSITAQNSSPIAVQVFDAGFVGRSAGKKGAGIGCPGTAVSPGTGDAFQSSTIFRAWCGHDPSGMPYPETTHIKMLDVDANNPEDPRSHAPMSASSCASSGYSSNRYAHEGAGTWNIPSQWTVDKGNNALRLNTKTLTITPQAAYGAAPFMPDDYSLRDPYNSDPLMTYLDTNPDVFASMDDPERVMAWRFPYRDAWRTLCVIQNPTPGDVYYIHFAKTQATPMINGTTRDQFALRAFATNGSPSFNPANNIPTNQQPQQFQPQISAWYAITSIVNDVNAQADYWVADIPDFYAGQVVVFEMFDFAESVAGAEVLTPDRNPIACQLTVGELDGEQLFPVAGGAATVNPCFVNNPAEQSGTIPEFPTNTHDDGIWSTTLNGRMVTLRIPIPADYTCDDTVQPSGAVNTSVGTTANGCWWSIKYDTGSESNDTTTWRVYMEGDPVHLTD